KYNWIDAPASKGKASGAFSHPTVPSANPYILLNYLGSTRDVMTLAHELGHGIHQVLASNKGALQCSTPLTLAETASVFGEMLTFKHMLRREKNNLSRRVLLSGKIEDMLNTTVRQISFHEFETIFHNQRLKGEVSLEKICKIWLDVQRESLGPVFNFQEEYKYYWSYVSHFIHVPFYVYAYAFGDCLVNSLYDVYASEGVDSFEQKYINMLRAGGTLRHNELLKPFDLNTSDPKFWKLGVNTIIKLIDDLENII
ncbi:MAG: oligoendopeptidase F, partial [Alphaproteobacteria bacterium TMED87]